LQDEAEKEAAGQVNMNEVERKAIEELAQVMGVTIKDITADGHCLYNAVADQLLQHYQLQVGCSKPFSFSFYQSKKKKKNSCRIEP
jgi:OTU domain-containing protein 6